jgi:hypothetical protein
VAIAAVAESSVCVTTCVVCCAEIMAGGVGVAVVALRWHPATRQRSMKRGRNLYGEGAFGIIDMHIFYT